MAPAKPKPTARAQIAEEPPQRVAVNLPSPEKLGILPQRSQPDVDWTETRRRLRELGALSFQLDHPPEGGCRFTCLLPTADPARSHRIDAQSATEAEAIRLALARAAEWKKGKP
jgi:hypothetical protein